jgi:hypothetical protein
MQLSQLKPFIIRVLNHTNGIWDQNENTGWQKGLLGGTAKYMNYENLKTGGTDMQVRTADYINNDDVKIGGKKHAEFEEKIFSFFQCYNNEVKATK